MKKMLIQEHNLKNNSRITESVFKRWESSFASLNKKNDEEEEKNTINIFGEIGDVWDGTGITAKRIAGILRGMKGEDITVVINSPGGSVFEGIAIYNMLAQHEGKVTVNIIGLAASIASVIAMAGEEIIMAESGLMMIHNSWGVVVGNAFDMREAAKVFDKFDESLVGIYRAFTGKDEKEIKKMMAEETWLDAKEALENGFVTKVIDNNKNGKKEEEEEEEGEEKKEKALAKRKIERGLDRLGYSKKEKEDIFKLSGLSDSALEDKSDSCAEETMSLLIKALRK